jgi:predicted transcriptional regulator
MNERRTPYEVYWEILVFCREPRSFTSIINRCDLNSKIGKQYVDFLVQRSCLCEENVDGKKTYLCMEKGTSFIQTFNQLYKSLFENPLSFKLP